MATTPNLSLSLIEQSQAQKEVTANEAFLAIDAVLNSGAIDKDISTPPVSPQEGDIYIVASGGTNDWDGRDGDIAWFYQSWRFIRPKEGMMIWVSDEDTHYIYDGTAWGTLSISGTDMLGINATADTTNRLALKSTAALFDAVTDSIYFKINKVEASDSASLLFQQGYGGHAEMGLLGSNNFTVKTSPDGSSWKDSFVVSAADASVEFKEGVMLRQPISLASYTVASAPSAAAHSGGMIYVSNGAAGSPVLSFSNGLNWLRCDTRTAISAT